MINWKGVGVALGESLLNALAMWLVLTGVVFLIGSASDYILANVLSIGFGVAKFLNKDVSFHAT